MPLGAGTRGPLPLIVAAALSCTASAQNFQPAPADNRGRLGIGVNYPGVGVRYFATDHVLLEARGQLEKDATAAGMRVAGYFQPLGIVLPFVGLESDYVTFSGDQSKGQGYAGEAFAGGELFLTSRVSLQLDFGPAYLYLRDKNTTLTAGGLEYVVNFGLNCYFFGRSSEDGRSLDSGSEDEEAPAPRKPSKKKKRPELDQLFYDWRPNGQ